MSRSIFSLILISFMAFSSLRAGVEELMARKLELDRILQSCEEDLMRLSRSRDSSMLQELRRIRKEKRLAEAELARINSELQRLDD